MLIDLSEAPTVAELICELQKFDGDLPVRIMTLDGMDKPDDIRQCAQNMRCEDIHVGIFGTSVPEEWR
jgi:hypothetical protein